MTFVRRFSSLGLATVTVYRSYCITVLYRYGFCCRATVLMEMENQV